MAQTAGVICILSLGENRLPKTVYFLTIDKAKFRKPVIPGDTVTYHMTKINKRRAMWRRGTHRGGRIFTSISSTKTDPGRSG